MKTILVFVDNIDIYRWDDITTKSIREYLVHPRVFCVEVKDSDYYLLSNGLISIKQFLEKEYDDEYLLGEWCNR